MSAHTLDQFARRRAIASIQAYQRHLSPHKGFACPYRVLHQTDSCSDYVKALLGQHSLSTTLKLAPRRFRACRAAALTLQQTAGSRGRCIVIPCCIPI